MALEYVSKWFSKVGRGVPQTEQVDENGQPLFEDGVDKEGKPIKVRKIGNEQYQAKQLIEDIPFKGDNDEPDTDVFLSNILEATEGDLELASKCFTNGFNKYLRLKAGGLDEYQKAARGIIKLALKQFEGMSVDEVAEFLKNADTSK